MKRLETDEQTFSTPPCFNFNLKLKKPNQGKTAERVQVRNNWVLGFGVIVIVVQVLGKYMIIRYLDP